jgi:hypothetical protein
MAEDCRMEAVEFRVTAAIRRSRLNGAGADLLSRDAAWHAHC